MRGCGVEDSFFLKSSRSLLVLWHSQLEMMTVKGVVTSKNVFLDGFGLPSLRSFVGFFPRLHPISLAAYDIAPPPLDPPGSRWWWWWWVVVGGGGGGVSIRCCSLL